MSLTILRILEVSEREPFTHELELLITLPHQLVTGFRIVGATQVSSDARDESHRVM